MREIKEDSEFLKKAVSEAVEGATNNGGPFGAVLVYKGKIIARSHNTVTQEHDPTAHAEINVIRKAASILQTHDLSGAVLYTSCEPCPMCLAATYWAHIDKVVYASTRRDAAKAGFLDDEIYNELARPPEQRRIEHIRMEIPGHDEPFTEWTKNNRKTPY
ncbi:MAG: nucleoside deaminase [Chlorobi bacterium]|nr:nucleoside deaminase [Chlorobiota bacterium]